MAGTTRLALEAASAARDGFADGVWLADLASVVDACVGLVQSLLASAPGLRVLATSRRVPAIPAERLVVVHPQTQTDAVHLLADRAAAVEPEFG